MRIIKLPFTDNHYVNPDWIVGIRPTRSNNAHAGKSELFNTSGVGVETLYFSQSADQVAQALQDVLRCQP